MARVKEAAQRVIDELPDHASWDDLMYKLYVQQKISAGLQAAEEGRVVPHDEVKRRFLST